MIGKVYMLALLVSIVAANAVQAGEYVIRETETGIYVELTGEKGPDPAVAERAEAAAAARKAEAQEAADHERRMDKLSEQKARLQARRMKMQQEGE